jgi:hypothetical protein
MLNVAHRLRLALLPLIVATASCFAQQTELPDAPRPTADVLAEIASAVPLTPMLPMEGQQTFPPTGYRRFRSRELGSGWLPIPRPCITDYCTELPPHRSCCEQDMTLFETFLRQNAVHIYTPRELAAMAGRGVIDPFNLLTIVGTSAYTVGTDSHSPYGPGGLGLAKLSGITLTEDMTNAFFETFLIPSIDHQNPQYHRMPNTSLTRRVAHTIYQPIWTESDTGKGMVNYATLLGAMADEAIDVTYVPFQERGLDASATRVGVNLATTPIGNMVTEFLPDVARHVNFNVVFIQRIINRVAIEDTIGPANGGALAVHRH